MKRLVGILLFILVIVPALPAQSQEADSSLGLSIRPAIFDISADPGTTTSMTIAIENISDSAIGVEIGAASLLPNDATIDQSKREEADASTWVINKGRKIALAIGEIENIPIQFLVPEDATPGTHHALITFTTTNPADINGSGTVVTPVINSLALVNVTGDIFEEMSIGDLNLPLLIFGNDHELSFAISNTGNVHSLPSGTVRLYDRSDNLVDTITVPPQLILPNTIKDYIAEWTNDGRVGVHHIEVEVSYGSPTQYTSVSSGTIVLMPNLTTILFVLSLVAAAIVVLLIIFRGPLRSARASIKSNKYRLSLRDRTKKHEDNRPEEMAKISMSSAKLNELLSSGGGRQKPKPRPTSQPKPAAPKAQKKKIIVQ